ncbi:DUF4231 domain-containing protein [Flavobacterium sp. MAH-1]|nr:DUF4231 domain-containing protein [Flavobacterium agri]NUY81897.1 DUF4231 domain-containing protein [Flavobacterium agri]
MKLTDFPGLYQAADKSSLESQSAYKKIIGYDLTTMVVAAGLSIYNFQDTNPKLIIYIISGLFLLTGLILTILIRTKKYEDIWYQGRALAESAKTLTWRYITCSENFEANIPEETASKIFIERLKELNTEFKELAETLDARLLSQDIITSQMNKIRRLNFLERKQFYIENRIGDQQKWYADKAEFNKTRYQRWFLLIIICQAISLISVAYLIKFPASDWNFVGFFTTIAASAISWLQLKQHQELKQAYTTAAHELTFILASAGRVNNDDDLAVFVLDSENAISREHTLWRAQRRT